MAGHSKFKNIMHRKGAQDKKRARVFARLSREIQVAARIGGVDSGSNPRLRTALQTARAQNMPKDNIDRALARAAGENIAVLEEIRYEGYGSAGIAIIVECLTDNRNRTVSQVRAGFSKFGGNLAQSNSVLYLFDRVGEVVFDPGIADEEQAVEAAIVVGVDDYKAEETGLRFFTPENNLHTIADQLSDVLGGAYSEAQLVWRPQNYIDLDPEEAGNTKKILEALEECEDVQQVFSNINPDYHRNT